jgi:hypothetical protein
MLRTFEVLDLSISHLPAELRPALAEAPGVIAEESPYGWWLWVPTDVGESTEPSDEPLPVAVVYLQHFARHIGCDWIRFDGDGETLSSLPVWPEPEADQ